MKHSPAVRAGWRERLHEIVYESDTFAGRSFDIVLLWCILASVIVVMLESVASVRATHGNLLSLIEWGFTLLFTIEYVLRLLSVEHPWRYARSFYGVVDLLSILPTYLNFLVPGLHTLLIIRILRLLRLFRVFKMTRYVVEADVLVQALRASWPKITIFLSTIILITAIMGALMYTIEGPANGFENIPAGMYWAIVTLTTVGFGDIVPHTLLGRFFSSALMVFGYGIIAVPTGFVTVELARAKSISVAACKSCGKQGHDIDARHCKYCGGKL